jgi:acetate kinase
MSARRILILNAGSSSLKFAVYDVASRLVLQLSGQISGLGLAPQLAAQSPGQDRLVEDWSDVDNGRAALERLFDWLEATRWADGMVAVGHRIVHGGRDFVAPTALTPDALHRLQALSSLAPLHQPFNLAAVNAAAARFPRILQVGVFDTAFHAGQPRIARLYALPRDLIDAGLVAYGFHGLSYDYIAGVLREEHGPQAGGRCIVLHLGSGVSLCALKDGESIATTMGFSALDGPPMSTRSGSLDPGLVLHLLQTRGMTADAVSDLLYNRSGLLGVSGLSGDMITLLASDNPHARQAIELYVYRIALEIGSLAAALGGLDTLVFTAGVGENAAPIRAAIAQKSGWLGVRLDPAANHGSRSRISSAESAVSVKVIPTDEQLIIARGVLALLDAPRPVRL